MEKGGDSVRDLAEVRKLIEGMNALVSSHQQLQQQKNISNEESKEGEYMGKPPISKSSGIPDRTDQPGTAANSDISSGSRHDAAKTTSENGLEATPANTIIIEVTHNNLNRTLYFSLVRKYLSALGSARAEATIEPLITWLRLSFADRTISGMVLQYKGLDGLWKCLLNRDDALRRVLKQSSKTGSMTQMRVPRAQDLLSSGYADKRLLDLTIQ